MLRLLILLMAACSASPALAQASACIWAGTVAACLPPTGIQLTQQQSIRYGDSGRTNYVQVKAPSSVTTYTILWPSAQGSGALVDDGSGNLSWSATGGLVAASSTSNGYLTSTDWTTFNGVTGKASKTLNNLGTTSINANLLPSAAGTRSVGTTTLPFGAMAADGFVIDDGNANGAYTQLTRNNLGTGYTLVFPNAQGGATTVLQNDGAGVLSWVSSSLLSTQASSTANGYLASTDWTTFNGKQATLSAASATVNGYLTSTDWTTFNGVTSKVPTSRSVSTTAPLSGGGALSSDLTLSISQAANATNGYLGSSDWQAFNSIARVAGTGSVNGYLVSTDWTAFNGGGRVAGTATVNGYLASSDWTTFNGRVISGRTISTTSPLSGGGDLSANRTLTISQANSTTNGYLGSTDWTTFNGKQARLSSSCTVRSYSETSSGSTFTPCTGTEVITGGGCIGSGSTAQIYHSYPATLTTWNCAFTAANAWSAQIVCCPN